MTRIHGNKSTYREGCRCSPCTDANSADCQDAARRRDPQNQPHGTTSTFVNYGCRCDLCVAAQTEAQARRRHRVTDAPKHRYPWTGAELEYIMQMDPNGRRYLTSATECAEMLGRTVSAVDKQRHNCRADAHKAGMAGLTLRPVP